MLAPFLELGCAHRVRHDQSALVLGGMVWFRLSVGGVGGATDASP